MNINVLKQTNLFAQLSEPELTCIARDLVERCYGEGEIIFQMRRSPQLALNFMQELSQRVRYNTRQLASLIGASRESTNKNLRDFQRRQWVQLVQGHIIVLDPDGLRGQVQVSG